MISSTATTSPLEEAALAVLETVPLVMRAIRARMREGRPESISVPQFRALLYVQRHPGTDLSAVADHVGTSLPAASELVARLVRQQLVVRETDPASRRRICLTLSPSGLADLVTAQMGTTEWLMELLSCLDAARLVALTTGLRDLRALAAQAEGSSAAVP